MQNLTTIYMTKPRKMAQFPFGSTNIEQLCPKYVTESHPSSAKMITVSLLPHYFNNIYTIMTDKTSKSLPHIETISSPRNTKQERKQRTSRHFSCVRRD